MLVFVLDVVPLAADTIVDQMTDAVAVLDGDGPERTPTNISAVLRGRVRKVEDGHEPVTMRTAISDDSYVVCEGFVGDGGRVEIADNGPGIPEKSRGEVFAPGAQAGEGGTTGFGLYLVKVMMEEYGGSVQFESDDPRETVTMLTFQSARAVEADGSDWPALRAQTTADHGPEITQKRLW